MDGDQGQTLGVRLTVLQRWILRVVISQYATTQGNKPEKNEKKKKEKVDVEMSSDVAGVGACRERPETLDELSALLFGGEGKACRRGACDEADNARRWSFGCSCTRPLAWLLGAGSESDTGSCGACAAIARCDVTRPHGGVSLLFFWAAGTRATGQVLF